MPAALDALIVGLYVQIDDFLGPRHRGPGRPPKLSDAELIALAVAQVLLGMPNDRQFLALARWRLRHLFPRLIDQSGYNRRLRGLAPQIGRCISYLAWISPSFCDQLRLLDSTPVPCGQSRETARRSEFAGTAGYGYCRSHSRWFWGFRLYLICSGDGMPIGWELAGANIGERVVAAEMLERIPVRGHTVIADKNFSGREFEALMADHGANFRRPDRKDEPRRHGSLGHIRQWIESTFQTCKGQLGLERHGARTLTGLGARIGLRLLALAAGIWHNHQTANPARAFAAYGR
jgi:Transposase DDE domain